MYKLENLITFEDYNALKVKIINVTLTANVATGDSISAFCIIILSKKKLIFMNTGTSYATILVFYK